MAGNSGAGDATILTSDWLGLNPLLVASFYPVNSKGLRDDQDQIEVRAVLLDGNVEASFNWQSPFEGSSPDSKAPALTAMLQSGALLNVMNDLRASVGGKQGSAASPSDPGATTKALQDVQGRTGITKINSTQIFSGMPPIKLTGVLLLRAFIDPKNEVEAPLQQLWSWALPQKLSSDSIVARATSSKSGVSDYVSALLPSLAPQMIGVTYKRRSYAPMVIESFGEPLSSPVTQDGYYTEIALPITICSLTALDKDDMRRFMTPS